MKTNRPAIHSLCAAALLVSFATNAQGAIILQGTYSTPADGGYYVDSDYSDRYETLRADSPLPTLTADFSTLGDTTIDFTWSAPEGHAFEIYVPVGMGWEDHTENFANFDFQFGSSSGGSPTFPNFNSLTVGGSTGAALPASPTVDLVAVSSAGDPVISGNVTFDGLVVGERYTFSSVTVSFTIPESYDAIFADEPLNPPCSEFYAYIYSDGNEHPDPGPILNLVAVPEPSSALLAGIGAIGIAAMRRRRG